MKTLTKNKIAYFEYDILQEYVSGIKLIGSEIKPIKGNMATIKDSFCYIKNNEIFLKGMHVPVKLINAWSHEPSRDRKLLLNKSEIIKIGKLIAQDGLTLVPLSINLTRTGLIKVKLGLGKGKKLYDKRNSLREKDLTMEINRKTIV
jgi:SsrA-binding protein